MGLHTHPSQLFPLGKNMGLVGASPRLVSPTSIAEGRGISSELAKPMSEPQCAHTAPQLDLHASEITFQSLYNTQWSISTEHLQPLSRGNRMTATSVIPSRGEEATFSLSLFFLFLFTYAIIVLSIIWICLYSCCCPAVCSSQITFQK